MEPAQVTAIAITILTPLTPFLTKAGEAIAEEVGKSVMEHGRRIYRIIQAKLDRDPDQPAQQALQTLNTNPLEAQTVLQQHLEQKMRSDDAFATILTNEVDALCITLFDCLQKKFTGQDLRKVYFLMGLTYDALMGDVNVGISDKAIGLIEYARARNQLPQLIRAMWKAYPGLYC